MKIQKITTSYIVLVHHYELPFLMLASGKHLESLTRAYNFREVELLKDSNTGSINKIVLKNGIFSSSDGTEVAVSGLEIEDRKIVIKTESPSIYSEELFTHLVSILRELAEISTESFLEPIIIAYESNIIANLKFHVSILLSKDYYDFIQSNVYSSTTSELADVKIVPLVLEFEIDYLIKDYDLNQHRIGLSRKRFAVQPAVGHPIDDQIFYSSAPVDTKTHILLLEQLEERMVRKGNS